MDDQVKPPSLVVDGADVTPCAAVEEPAGDSVVRVVLDAVSVVLEVRVVVVVDDTVVSTPPDEEAPGSSKPASRAQAAASSPSRQQKPGTGAHHVPASQ